MSYAGEITPVEVWEKLQSASSAYIVDVRTQAEWSYVGVPALPESVAPMIGQEWQVFPTMAVDPGFGETLSKRLADVGATKDSELFFLCRSGVRSLAAVQHRDTGSHVRHCIFTGCSGRLSPVTHFAQN